MTFEDDLAEEPEERPYKDVDVLLKKNLHVLRFTQLPGEEWSWLVAINPVRLEVPLDKQYGYNYHAVCKAAAVLNVQIVVDGNAEPLGEGLLEKLWPRLDGNTFTRIADAVWELNEWAPSQLVAQAKKASRLAQKDEPA